MTETINIFTFTHQNHNPPLQIIVIVAFNYIITLFNNLKNILWVESSGINCSMMPKKEKNIIVNISIICLILY